MPQSSINPENLETTALTYTLVSSGTHQETPKPGSYEYPTFIEEMSVRPNTYRFRSDGRKIDPHPHGKGAMLLPGAYESQNFIER